MSQISTMASPSLVGQAIYVFNYSITLNLIIKGPAYGELMHMYMNNLAINTVSLKSLRYLII